MESSKNTKCKMKCKMNMTVWPTFYTFQNSALILKVTALIWLDHTLLEYLFHNFGNFCRLCGDVTLQFWNFSFAILLSAFVYAVTLHCWNVSFIILKLSFMRWRYIVDIFLFQDSLKHPNLLFCWKWMYWSISWV